MVRELAELIDQRVAVWGAPGGRLFSLALSPRLQTAPGSPTPQ